MIYRLLTYDTHAYLHLMGCDRYIKLIHHESKHKLTNLVKGFIIERECRLVILS